MANSASHQPPLLLPGPNPHDLPPGLLHELYPLILLCLFLPCCGRSHPSSRTVSLSRLSTALMTLQDFLGLWPLLLPSPPPPQASLQRQPDLYVFHSLCLECSSHREPPQLTPTPPFSLSAQTPSFWPLLRLHLIDLLKNSKFPSLPIPLLALLFSPEHLSPFSRPCNLHFMSVAFCLPHPVGM